MNDTGLVLNIFAREVDFSSVHSADSALKFIADIPPATKEQLNSMQKDYARSPDFNAEPFDIMNDKELTILFYSIEMARVARERAIYETNQMMADRARPKWNGQYTIPRAYHAETNKLRLLTQLLNDHLEFTIRDRCGFDLELIPYVNGVVYVRKDRDVVRQTSI